VASFPAVKQCIRCAENKPASAFSRTRREKDGYQKWCKPCSSAYKKEYYQKHGAKVREARRVYRLQHGLRQDLKKCYNITPRQYYAMLEAQGGLCAICGTIGDGDSRLTVDHDHATGVIRALLCGSCNRGIGQFKDDAARLLLAADYLRKHQ
jgi:hypothetical protein